LFTFVDRFRFFSFVSASWRRNFFIMCYNSFKL